MKKVLIVDDSPFLRNSLKEVLGKKFSGPEELQIIEAGNRTAALQEFDRQAPDLILLDIVMREGEREGIKVLEEIRSPFKTKTKTKTKTPVLILTAVGQEAIVQECEKLGIEGYILKPFDEDEIVKAVQRCLA